MDHRFRAGGAGMTCSIGVASYPEDATDRSKLVELADTAMYQAKRHGRNCTVAANAASPAELDGVGPDRRDADRRPIRAGSSKPRRRAEYLADHDILTGLYNRGRLTDEVDRQLRDAARGWIARAQCC